MRLVLCSIALILGCGVGPRAGAESPVGPLAQTAQARVSLNEAADMVQRRTGGRVLAAQAVNEGGRLVYRIKVLTRDGEVRVVLVDAQTGRME